MTKAEYRARGHATKEEMDRLALRIDCVSLGVAFAVVVAVLCLITVNIYK